MEIEEIRVSPLEAVPMFASVIASFLSMVNANGIIVENKGTRLNIIFRDNRLIVTNDNFPSLEVGTLIKLN